LTGQKHHPQNFGLARQLLDWYRKNARTLPWRVPDSRPHDPYRVWVSEIMLQQTTVKTVLPYFGAFLERFPCIHTLARADLQEVYAVWQGLGYYRRARMMHQCARLLVETRGGVFPDNLEELRKLPGIGAYTAGAIRAIAFQKRAVAMDGNVRRVLGRWLGQTLEAPVTEKAMHDHLENITPEAQCGDFVQGLMELGATLCMPRQTLCTACPWGKSCQTHIRDLPRVARVQPAAAKPRRFGGVWFVTTPAGAVLMEKRPEKGLLAGQTGLPGTPWQTCPSASPWSPDWGAPPVPCVSGEWTGQGIVHVFTHFTLHLDLFRGTTPEGTGAPPGLFWCSPEQMARHPVPSLYRKVLKAGGY
jgi:A/G-specific adenine glycosylase